MPQGRIRLDPRRSEARSIPGRGADARRLRDREAALLGLVDVLAGDEEPFIGRMIGTQARRSSGSVTTAWIQSGGS